MGFLTKEQSSQIESFQKKLLEKNKQINLVSRKNPEEQISLLLKEGLELSQFLKALFQKKNQKILDIGSGNGFPGLLFAILFPQNKFFLCERRRKKAEALKWISFQCGLSNTEMLCQSAESLKPNYDLILSQASMPPDEIKNLLKKLLNQKNQAFLWLSKKQTLSFQPSFDMEKLSHPNPNKTIVKLQQAKSFNA